MVGLQTGEEVEQVWIHYGDPFSTGILGGNEAWEGSREEIVTKMRLPQHLWWEIPVQPPYKRCRYFFEDVYKRQLLEDAREEVYLNADFDLSRFAETFHRLKKKGVRIVAFSFYDLGLNREDVEFYTHGGMLTAHQPSRLMLVTDRQMTLTADCGAFANWSGTVSNNGLMVKILSEHIQHDITLLQLQEKYGLEMH